MIWEVHIIDNNVRNCDYICVRVGAWVKGLKRLKMLKVGSMWPLFEFRGCVGDFEEGVWGFGELKTEICNGEV